MSPPIDKAYLRSLFLQDKVVLKTIFDSTDESVLFRYIRSLETEQLNNIIRICHLIAIHEIKINKECGKIIVSKKSKSFLFITLKIQRLSKT